MPKTLSIYVAGGFASQSPGVPTAAKESIIAFSRCLAQEIIRQGHNLLNGCRTELDSVLAEAAFEELTHQGIRSSDRRLISYVLEGMVPVHKYGTVLISELSDWDIGGMELQPPEVIKEADVVILIGGCDGLFHAANWARLQQKPIIAFYSFGGVAREAYKVETRDFDKKYGDKVSSSDYDQVVKSITQDWPELARDTVALVERLRTSRFVLVIMSFRESPELSQLYEMVKDICDEVEYKARRVDDRNFLRPIVPEIIRQMYQSAFVIADITGLRANVFYELGFAHGLGKDTVLLAKKGTEKNLPFDIKDWPLLVWDTADLDKFKEKFRERIEAIGKAQGRDELREE